MLDDNSLISVCIEKNIDLEAEVEALEQVIFSHIGRNDEDQQK